MLKGHGDLPVTLIGWSWGAMLSFVCAAQYPSFVKKLVLVGSAPYEEKYAVDITKTRLSRLVQEERAEALTLIEVLDNPAVQGKDAVMARPGRLFSKADSFDPLPDDSEVLECQYDVYQSVWKQASELRSSGGLLEVGKRVQCPVVAIHGDYDPHPTAGIREPLSRVLADFRFVLLRDCGHQPWIERQARDKFFSILRNEVLCCAGANGNPQIDLLKPFC